jgi:hypothetical protein
MKNEDAQGSRPQTEQAACQGAATPQHFLIHFTI